MEMLKFDPARTCPQCENVAQFKYHDDATYHKECGGLAGLDRKGATTHVPVPHMHRTCTVCGFEWAEMPIAA